MIEDHYDGIPVLQNHLGEFLNFHVENQSSLGAFVALEFFGCHISPSSDRDWDVVLSQSQYIGAYLDVWYYFQANPRKLFLICQFKNEILQSLAKLHYLKAQ